MSMNIVCLSHLHQRKQTSDAAASHVVCIKLISKLSCQNWAGERQRQSNRSKANHLLHIKLRICAYFLRWLLSGAFEHLIIIRVFCIWIYRKFCDNDDDEYFSHMFPKYSQRNHVCDFIFTINKMNTTPMQQQHQQQHPTKNVVKIKLVFVQKQQRQRYKK